MCEECALDYERTSADTTLETEVINALHVTKNMSRCFNILQYIKRHAQSYSSKSANNTSFNAVRNQRLNAIIIKLINVATLRRIPPIYLRTIAQMQTVHITHVKHICNPPRSDTIR